MSTYQAPAKLNLSLHVMPPRGDGYHPLQSMVQTIEWCDVLSVEQGEGDDALIVEGKDVGVEDNLVLRAVNAMREHGSIPPLRLRLDKEIPVAAGLGGGSSDAAAALVASAAEGRLPASLPREVAPKVGADVSLFLVGGTLMMSGVGERLSPLSPLRGLAVAVAVPEFVLSTAEVYRRWDEMEGPEGDPIADDDLPPSLRGGMPIRNDLLPAAVDLEPRLGDFLTDLRVEWGTAVCLTGSGSACFGFFPTLDEALDAAEAVTHFSTETTAVHLRDHGVSLVEDEEGLERD